VDLHHRLADTANPVRGSETCANVRDVIALVLILALCAVPLVFGYRMVSGAVSVRAANGVALLILGAALVIWLLSNLTFDAGF
jgi:hypothetical protein